MGNVEDSNLLFLGKTEIMKQLQRETNTLCFEQNLKALLRIVKEEKSSQNNQMEGRRAREKTIQIKEGTGIRRCWNEQADTFRKFQVDPYALSLEHVAMTGSFLPGPVLHEGGDTTSEARVYLDDVKF